MEHKSSKTTEIYTHISKRTIDKIKNPVDDFFEEDNIKEKYKLLCLATPFGGINTIEVTQSLTFIVNDHKQRQN